MKGEWVKRIWKNLNWKHADFRRERKKTSNGGRMNWKRKGNTLKRERIIVIKRNAREGKVKKRERVNGKRNRYGTSKVMRVRKDTINWIGAREMIVGL